MSSVFSDKTSDFGELKDSANAQVVNDFHKNSDVDTSPEAQHHTLGIGANKASPGDHRHNGEDSPLLLEGVTIGGSRTNGDALNSLLTALAGMGLQNETTA